MAEAPADNESVVHVNFDFRRKVAEKIEGNLASFCYQCGACVGDCPAVTTLRARLDIAGEPRVSHRVASRAVTPEWSTG